VSTAPQPPRYPDRDRNDEGKPENARPRDRFGAPLPRGSVDELAHREEPEDVVESLGEAFDRAVELFDAERFFEAHEFLEYVWKAGEIDDADRDFWKGVTQVAVGCCHVQRGNATGAVTLLERATRYLQPYPGQYHGVDAAELTTRARRLADTVKSDGPGPDREFFRFPRAAAHASRPRA
jgi:uncharacterized protein